MVDSKCESNVATVSGKIITEPVFGHEIYGEGFYYFDVQVRRLSESYDIIPPYLNGWRIAPNIKSEDTYKWMGSFVHITQCRKTVLQN